MTGLSGGERRFVTRDEGAPRRRGDRRTIGCERRDRHHVGQFIEQVLQRIMGGVELVLGCTMQPLGCTSCVMCGIHNARQAAKLIVQDIAYRVVSGEEHPSDGPIAKLSYAELYVELCERAIEMLASSWSSQI